MVYSMTGFGAGEASVNGISYKVELKTLNSKGLDITLKLPLALRATEAQARQLLSSMVRGKVECIVTEAGQASSVHDQLNITLLETYYEQVSTFAAARNLSMEGILPALLQMPGIIGDSVLTESEDTWKEMSALLSSAVAKLNLFRQDEGKALADDLLSRVAKLRALLTSIQPFEEARVPRVKERYEQALRQLSSELQADPGRLEMEMIFYVEKLDISEEKVRLGIHCDYFEQELLAEGQIEKGKKLGFMTQEMGREVNTIGSKANDASIQQIVVQMKDEIEKIKEQVSNIL
jgi:uncharacterized protein (TIGR00255 family)